MKAPFPYFGGKSRVAQEVWDRFGNVENYVEPFFGSGAVLLARPEHHTPFSTETVNDLDCLIANFWRAITEDPEGVCLYADQPVNEANLHAVHLWLVGREDFRERMKTDIEYFDSKIAGRWVWGISQWIGSGWCSQPGWRGRTNAGAFARGVQALHNKRPMVHGGHTGKGVHAINPGVASQFGSVSRAAPCGHNMGIHAKRTGLGDQDAEFGVLSDDRSGQLLDYFYALTSRLRRVRVCCGDWKRVTGPSITVKHGVTGVFLDPPYDMRVVNNEEAKRDANANADALYSHHSNDVSAEVREWAIRNGDNKLMRIALCGYTSEHAMPSSWEEVAWKAHGGYGNQREEGNLNAGRERIWFSPHCIRPQPGLFDFQAEELT